MVSDRVRIDRNGKDDIGVDRMRIGVDLLWVRVGICGGTESFIRNLLTGFWQYDTENEYVLFVSQDNEESFRAYERPGGGNLRLSVCPVKSASQPRRILWENMHLDRLARKQQINVMFIPVYSMPWNWGGKIPYVCVIHDLQALHYPDFFSPLRRLFLRYEWKHVCRKAHRVLTDSDFCRQDIERYCPEAKKKLQVMYVPIPSCGQEEAKEKGSEDLRPQILELVKQPYDYCVSSLLPHKNLDTLLQAVQLMCLQGIWGKRYLVISGVGGDLAPLEEKLKRYDIAGQVILTGYVSDAERDYLYEHCGLFLFPSIFEGFGMPPIEAMRRGKRVVMTRCSCLEEITRGRAVYVDEPYVPSCWQRQIGLARQMPETRELFPEYWPENIVRQYQQLWLDVADERCVL